MKKEISFFDIIRAAGALAVFVAGYLFAETLVLRHISLGDENKLWFLIIRYLLVEGVGCFASLFLGLLLVSRRFRYVTGTQIMIAAMVTYLALSLYAGIDHYITALSYLVGLSFIAVGCSFAMMLWSAIPLAKKKPSKTKIQENTKEPKTSGFLLFTAITSVPATYLTMILSAFITVGICAWVLAVFIAIGRIPTVILLAVIITPIIGLWVSGKAILAVFVNKPEEQPAVKVDLSGKPELKRTIAEVCAAIGTKMPDNVILHAEPTFFVTQAGIKTVDAKISGRTLAIGAPLLRPLTKNGFKAVLGHEFAHFSGNDTAYSSFVLPVYTSIITALNEFARGSQERHFISNLLMFVPMNFLNMFLTYFSTIDRIISRSRELRADWISAMKFGPDNLKASLLAVVRTSGHFYGSYAKVIPEQANYFEAYHSMAATEKDKMEDIEKKEMEREETEFDSHPSIRARFASLPRAAVSSVEFAMDGIISELKQDEDRLADAFYNRIKGNLPDGLIPAPITDVDLELLNNSMSALVQEWNDEGISGKLMHHLFMTFLNGDAVPDKDKAEVMKVIDMFRSDVKLFDLISTGAAIRADILDRHNYKTEATALKTAYSDLGVDLENNIKAGLPSVEEYAKIAISYCSEMHKKS